MTGRRYPDAASRPSVPRGVDAAAVALGRTPDRVDQWPAHRHGDPRRRRHRGAGLRRRPRRVPAWWSDGGPRRSLGGERATDDLDAGHAPARHRCQRRARNRADLQPNDGALAGRPGRVGRGRRHRRLPDERRRGDRRPPRRHRGHACSRSGDNAYENGTFAEYNECYGPSWGRHKARTGPCPATTSTTRAGAAGYYRYFGAAAGDPDEGWYAYDLGSWRIYALNSNCEAIGGCGPGSAQEQWLRADLAANPTGVRRRVLAPPSVQLERARQQLRRAGPLAGAVRRERGADPRRPRPHLRAIRAADGRRARRPGARDRVVRRRAPAGDGCTSSHTIRANSLVRETGDTRRAEADALGRVLRVRVRAGGRQDLHRLGSGTCH